MRKFSYASITNQKLNKNACHLFALRHAISIYNLDTVYSFIPKNACSSLRWSAAISNGIATIDGDVNWIHKNNKTFMPSLEFAVKAKYAFIVLRCPYRRLASAFLDKLVNTHETCPADSLPASFQGKIIRSFSRNKYYKNLSFKDFCKLVDRQDINQLNPHWRPQSAFLLFSNYDDYFCVEDFSTATKTLKTKGLDVVDTRAALKHDSSHYTQIDGNFTNLSVKEIRTMKSNGNIPSYSSLFDKECRDIIERKFSQDIQLYNSKFPKDWKLF